VGSSKSMLSIPRSVWRGGLTSVELPTFLINIIDGKFVVEDDVRQTGGHGGEWTVLIEGKNSITVRGQKLMRSQLGRE
jgi:hypothetical protein